MRYQLKGQPCDLLHPPQLQWDLRLKTFSISASLFIFQFGTKIPAYALMLLTNTVSILFMICWSTSFVHRACRLFSTLGSRRTLHSSPRQPIASRAFRICMGGPSAYQREPPPPPPPPPPRRAPKGEGHYGFCNLSHLLIAICTLR